MKSSALEHGSLGPWSCKLTSGGTGRAIRSLGTGGHARQALHLSVGPQFRWCSGLALVATRSIVVRSGRGNRQLACSVFAPPPMLGLPPKRRAGTI
jgi:hypothetical protein